MGIIGSDSWFEGHFETIRYQDKQKRGYMDKQKEFDISLFDDELLNFHMAVHRFIEQCLRKRKISPELINTMHHCTENIKKMSREFDSIKQPDTKEPFSDEERMNRVQKIHGVICMITEKRIMTYAELSNLLGVSRPLLSRMIESLSFSKQMNVSLLLRMESTLGKYLET